MAFVPCLQLAASAGTKTEAEAKQKIRPFCSKKKNQLLARKGAEKPA